MSYLAIARKWRPQRFDDVIGQPHVTRTLKNAIDQGRVHHAYLFTGARGVGKTSCARIFAKALNCVGGPSSEPCGECTSCTEIVSGAAPDVIEIDGASNNSVEEVRSLRDSARYMPARSAKKVYIIDEVHMLTQQAFNALLKTLEEPPGHVVFILATTEPQKIPDTILSRCLRFDFKRFSQRALVDSLGHIAKSEGIAISESSLMLIAREGEGSLRDAQSLLDQVIAFAGHEIPDPDVIEILGLIDRSLIFDILEAVVLKQPEKCLEVVERVFSFGYDLKQLARDILEGFRNLSVIKVASNADRFLDIAEEELMRLSRLARSADGGVLSRVFSILVDEIPNIHRSQAPRYLLEMVLLRMCRVGPAMPLDALLTRLNALEEGLKNAPVATRGPAEPRQNLNPPQWEGGNRGANHAPRSQGEDRPSGKFQGERRIASQNKWAEIRESTQQKMAEAQARAFSGDDDLPTMQDIPPGASPGQPGPGRTWIDFLRSMDRNNPRFQTLLHGVVVDQGPGVLKLVFPEELPVVLKTAERCQADAKLLAQLSDFFDGSMRLIVMGRPEELRDEESPHERMEREREARRQKLRMTLKSHRTVKEAVALFELDEQDISYAITLGAEPEL